jgi:urease accessory protein
MEMDSSESLTDFGGELAELRLLHLADSALPIGGLAHSFGLESLVARELLGVGELAEFLRGFLEEAGLLEAVFCREGFRVGSGTRGAGWLSGAGGESARLPSRIRVNRRRPLHLPEPASADFTKQWVELNDRLSARKTARESRMGSASLGKNFLTAVAVLGDFAMVREGLRSSKEAGSLIHHSVAFGLAGGVLGFVEDRTVLAYLHQCVASQVSACQRLLPLGQSAATRILWDLKPAMIETMKRSSACAVEDASCFMPLLDWGAMEHPALTTRLFIS